MLAAARVLWTNLTRCRCVSRLDRRRTRPLPEELVGGKFVALDRHQGDEGLRNVRGLSVSDSRLSGDDISSHHVQVVGGGFERLLGIMVRNKSGVFIKGHIALPAKTIKDSEQTGMFLVDARMHEIDDGDVVTRLTPRSESVTEHEPEGSFQHCFVSLLKTSFFIKKREFCWPRPASCPRSRGSGRFAPCQPRAALASSFGPMSETRLLCQRFSRNASFRARRESNSFGVRTV